MIGGVAFALKPTPAEAHPCQTPTQNFGIVSATVATEYQLHEGDCITRVSGNGRWMASFDFELAERRVVQIDLENVADVDPYLRLLDESGTVIASDDDSGNGLNARISRELNRGRYRIQATKYNASAGTVRLTIDVGPQSTSSPSPTPVRSLSAGSHHTCALLADGRLRCWGWNEDGQANARLGTFASVSAGLSHTCAIDTAGALQCWGQTAGIDGYPPIPASPEGSFTQVSAARFASTCAVTTGGEVQCWGFDNWGQATAPTGRFTQVSAAAFHACALTATGTIECWGNPADRSDPPAGMFTQISASMFYTCALAAGGAVRCWGDDIASSQANPPAGRFTQVDAGTSQACALTTGEEIRCWGGDSEPPTGRYSQVAVGAYHACAIRQDATVECWGLNHRGQLDIPEDLTTPAEPAAAGCPEPPQLFRVTETTPVARRIVREERLDTDCQVDGLPRGAVRPADRYAFTLDKPSRVSVELWSTAFPAYLFLTDANGTYYYLDGTEAEGGRRLSLSGSRAADGEGDAIIDSTTTGMTPASLNRVRLDAGSYWLFAVSASGSRTGDYRLVMEYERIVDSEPLDQQIAERFAPVLFFEQDESFFPVPVERMIELSTLHYTVGGQAHELAPGPGVGKEYGLADLVSHNGQDSYLDLEDVHRAATGDRVVYARVAEDDIGVLVQYWFFYLYNATGARPWNHEGDWEGIQLWFAGRGRDDLLNAAVPTQLGYAAHESGWVLTPSRNCRSVDAPFQPNVYVARNRHASYPEPGSGGTLDKSFDGQDQYQGNGAVWALPGRDVPDAEGDIEEYEIRILPSARQSWLTWQGKWGDKSGSDGPLGPAFKSHFWRPPALNDGWSGGRVFSCPSASE